MTVAQGAFLTAFSVVNLALVAVAVVMVRNARRMDGGTFVTWSLLSRLGRLPAERSDVNRWAFYAHRISGIGIFLFLCLHIIDVSLYAVSPSLYDEVNVLYGSAPMRVFEVGLLLALLFHALNGLRVIAIDVWDLGVRQAARLLAVVVVLTVALTGVGGVVILAPILTGTGMRGAP